MSIKKRTYINSDEELVVQGKLTVEGEFVQKDTTIVESQTLFDGNSLVINSDSDEVTARLSLKSNSNLANISYDYVSNQIDIDRDINVSGIVSADNISSNSTISGNISGNAGTATALETAQDFSITGDGTTTAVSFDGTAPVALNLTLVNTGVSATTYGAANTVPQFTVNTKGLLTSASDVLIDIESSQISDFTQSVRDSVSAGTGVTYSNATGVFSIGQPVETNSAVTFDSVNAQSIAVSTANANITLDDTGILFNRQGVLFNVTENEVLAQTPANVDSSFIIGGSLQHSLPSGDYSLLSNTAIISASSTMTISSGSLSITTSNFSLFANGSVVSNDTITADNFVGNVTGQVSDISNHTTDDLAEGNSNLYYSDSLVDSHLVGGDGIDYTTGTIAVDNTVVRTTGTQSIGGAKTFTQDVEIVGNLNVTANINSRTQTDLFIEDTSLTLANGAVSNVDAHIFVDGNYGGFPELPQIRWDSSFPEPKWEFTNNGQEFYV